MVTIMRACLGRMNEHKEEKEKTIVRHPHGGLDAYTTKRIGGYYSNSDFRIVCL